MSITKLENEIKGAEKEIKIFQERLNLKRTQAT